MPEGREGFPAAPEGAIATGTGNRRALLLAAVLAEPDSTDARAVYADALAAANDPRGELILIDLALEGPLSIRKRDQLRARKAELVRAHGKTWWPWELSRKRTHGGFLVAIAGTRKQIDGVAPELFAAEPVTEAEVYGVAGEAAIEDLLAATWLPRIHRLIVRGELGDAGFAALVSSPALAGVRSLNVTATDVGTAGLGALGGHLPRCRTLVLTSNALGGLAGLARWAHLPELETLYLGKCDLGATAVAELFAGPPLTKLAKLSLSGNALGNEGAATLARYADRLPALEHLELVQTGLGTAGVQKLLEAPLPRVRRIDVRKNNVDRALAADARLAV